MKSGNVKGVSIPTSLFNSRTTPKKAVLAYLYFCRRKTMEHLASYSIGSLLSYYHYTISYRKYDCNYKFREGIDYLVRKGYIKSEINPFDLVLNDIAEIKFLQKSFAGQHIFMSLEEFDTILRCNSRIKPETLLYVYLYIRGIINFRKRALKGYWERIDDLARGVQYSRPTVIEALQALVDAKLLYTKDEITDFGTKIYVLYDENRESRYDDLFKRFTVDNIIEYSSYYHGKDINDTI